MASELPAGNGRRIASKACDLCRARKRQCVFEGEDAMSCQKCIRAKTPCTFMTERRIRGPRSHRPILENLAPIGRIEVEHFCSVEMLHRFIADFDDFVYPLFPLVHQPTCHALLASGAFNTDGEFFRRCLSLCAITAASMPKRESDYCHGRYPNVQSLVDRACGLVMLSRLATDPAWQDNPTVAIMVDSTLLSLASHYTERANRGWSLANEAVVSWNALGLYEAEGLAKLNPIDAELSKRVFWNLHILQIYHLFTSITPKIVPGFPPGTLDWDCTLPMEMPGERQLLPVREGPRTNSLAPMADPSPTPVISGFINLVQLFSCLREIISADYYCSSIRTATWHEHGAGLSLLHTMNGQYGVSDSKSDLTDAECVRISYKIIEKFNQVLDLVPDELRFPVPVHVSRELDTSRRFDITRATLHVTSLYLQSSLIENLFESHISRRQEARLLTKSLGQSMESSAPSPSDRDHAVMVGDDGCILELWRLRQAIAEKLLHILEDTRREILECNGFQLVAQTRRIAATLLDCHDGFDLLPDIRDKVVLLVQRFVDILANLDQPPP